MVVISTQKFITETRANPKWILIIFIAVGTVKIMKLFCKNQEEKNSLDFEKNAFTPKRKIIKKNEIRSFKVFWNQIVAQVNFINSSLHAWGKHFLGEWKLH